MILHQFILSLVLKKKKVKNCCSLASLELIVANPHIVHIRNLKAQRLGSLFEVTKHVRGRARTDPRSPLFWVRLPFRPHN